MLAANGAFRVSLGSVVLDRPDRSGLYIAKDLIGGWAYLIADGAGDNRFRGQGVCDGGLDMALCCAFLAALSRIPECRQLRVLVETAPAHRAMAELARTDARVTAAIAGRPVAIMTRPDERAAFQVRAAAERAASAALLERERAELSAAHMPAAPAANGIARHRAPDRAAPGVQNPGEIADGGGIADLASEVAAVVARRVAAARDWRSRPGEDPRERLGAPVLGAPVLGAPVLGAPVPAAWRGTSPRSRILTDWLAEFDSRVERVSAELREVAR